MNYSPIPLAIVVDANTAVRAVMPIEQEQEMIKFKEWHQNKISLYAPDVYPAEITTAVRESIDYQLISPEEGTQILNDLFSLDVQVIPSDLDLCLNALSWAARLGQSKAYDSFYLALAERLSLERGGRVEFWTADERLYHRAHQVGFPGIRWTGEDKSSGGQL
jgi:predicted nucleic acid-binding protein